LTCDGIPVGSNRWQWNASSSWLLQYRALLENIYLETTEQMLFFLNDFTLFQIGGF
jgi:hypothetical protein